MNPRISMRKIRLPSQAAPGGVRPGKVGPQGEYFTVFVKYSG